VAVDTAFGDDATVEKDHRNAPVIEVVQTIVGVDVGELGLKAKLPEEAESLVAQMASLAGHQDQAHRRSRLAG
jgi:hypothetical protein